MMVKNHFVVILFLVLCVYSYQSDIGDDFSVVTHLLSVIKPTQRVSFNRLLHVFDYNNKYPFYLSVNTDRRNTQCIETDIYIERLDRTIDIRKNHTIVYMRKYFDQILQKTNVMLIDVGYVIEECIVLCPTTPDDVTLILTGILLHTRNNNNK